MFMYFTPPGKIVLLVSSWPSLLSAKQRGVAEPETFPMRYGRCCWWRLGAGKALRSMLNSIAVAMEWPRALEMVGTTLDVAILLPVGVEVWFPSWRCSAAGPRGGGDMMLIDRDRG